MYQLSLTWAKIVNINSLTELFNAFLRFLKSPKQMIEREIEFFILYTILKGGKIQVGDMAKMASLNFMPVPV